MSAEAENLARRNNSPLIAGFAICLGLCGILDAVKLGRLPGTQYAMLFPFALGLLILAPLHMREQHQAFLDKFSIRQLFAELTGPQISAGLFYFSPVLPAPPPPDRPGADGDAPSAGRSDPKQA